MTFYPSALPSEPSAGAYSRLALQADSQTHDIAGIVRVAERWFRHGRALILLVIVQAGGSPSLLRTSRSKS